MIKERIKKLRQIMAEKGLSGYLITDNDYHGSEYLSDYFKGREYITGFTGSAGNAVILTDKAGLWTDGRYFIQAEEQLENSGISLYKMGEEGVPTIWEFIEKNIKPEQIMAFDGKTVSASDGIALAEKGIKISYEEDLLEKIWYDRPGLPKRPAFELGPRYAGQSRENKIERVRAVMKQKDVKYHILTTLDDIAWLLNIRGDDVECTPVMLAYLIISAEEVILFADEKSVGHLFIDGITIKPYGDFYEYIKTIKGKTLLDSDKINYKLIQNIASNDIVDDVNPTTLMKAVKNNIEIENIRKAHIKDGIAVTKFVFWLKENVGKQYIDEIGAANKLEEFRKQQKNYIEPSFSPIVGYGANGAVIHYSATEKSNIELKPQGLVLIDTGGQYIEGTTDITRTVALGKLSEEEKRNYTIVLKGNLHLANAIFEKGTAGSELDKIARKPLNDLGLDYNHGTGHGVGYLLSVHEGPQTISRRETASQGFLPGMITSNEPGVYIEGKYGIRLENLMLCKRREGRETEHMDNKEMLEFETLTMVPWDKDAIVPEMLSEEERTWLNAYHRKVEETLRPYLTEKEIKELIFYL